MTIEDKEKHIYKFVGYKKESSFLNQSIRQLWNMEIITQESIYQKLLNLWDNYIFKGNFNSRILLVNLLYNMIKYK